MSFVDEAFPTWPRLRPEDVGSVVNVLSSSRLSQLSSSAVRDFERALADYNGVAHCIATNSGTAAIHTLLAALDIGPGDEVIVPAHTFIGSASPILHQRATPVFADVDPVSYCISPESVRRLVTPRTKAVIAVHLNGQPADMDPLISLGDRHGFAVLEDACQSHGARYGGRLVGNWGLAGTYSFWEDKIITTGGEGGAIITNHGALAERMRRIRQHGEDLLADTRLYCSHELGYNYRMTAMQAAMGCSQVPKLDEYVSIRRRNAGVLNRALKPVANLQVPEDMAGCEHSYWKYVCRIRGDGIEGSGNVAEEVVARLQARGIPAYRRYPIPLHRQPVFVKMGLGGRDCPVADQLADELFSLPVHPALEQTHLERVVEAVTGVMSEAQLSFA